ncbi:MAG TPA: nickel pincer cofactor biosynthesis protein LarB [Gemmatimonadales bacterium]|nr:nickel pincer cofactor biosynthesis protein LarB [Gemmatimonadales bacterium]
MTPAALADLLAAVAAGRISSDAALEQLRNFPSEQLPFATIDHHRALRQGRPEVIFSASKTADQVVAIAERLADAGGGFLATRVTDEQRSLLQQRFPTMRWSSMARVAWLQSDKHAEAIGTVAVVSAGTSDLPVAEEAAVVLQAFGHGVDRLVDVGVAGLHRLLAESDRLRAADVVIVVAGMEGALPSVVGGLLRQPVIAVPTSVGYGASFGGLAALLGMLNSCASGVTVVNIDNGFGAAVAASRILSR